MKYLFLIISIITINIISFGQSKVILDDSFDNNSNNWPLYDVEDIKSEIKKGAYILESKQDKSKWFYISTGVSFDTIDFILEAEMTQLSGYDNYGYGLVFSMYSDNSNYRTLFAASNQHLRINHYYNKEDHQKLPWTKNSAVNPMKKSNVFRVEKHSNIITYYINGEKIMEDGRNAYFGDRFGFYLSNKMQVKVDYIKLTTFPREINFIENHLEEQPRKALSSEVNDPNVTETIPVISADGKTLFCVRKDTEESTGGKDDDDVWVSTQNEKGEWSKLKNFGPPINNKGHNFVISISPDNNTLIIANTYNPDGSSLSSGASISRKTENGWEIPQTIEIKDFKNSNAYVGFSMAPDNKTIVMSVEREEGKGEKDLFVSFIQEDNTWSKPINMGQLNSSGDETTPFIAPDNKTIYFSSTGHYGLGHHDVFVSKRLDNSWINWTKPQNLGKYVNTSGSDLGFFIPAKGDVAYVSSQGDIYQIGNPAKPDPVVLVSGFVYDNKTKEPLSAKIKYYDLTNDRELGTAISDPNTGGYKIALPAGVQYSFLAEKEAFYSVNENLDLTDLTEYKELSKDLYLSPIAKGEVIRLNNIFFEFNESTLKKESYSELNRLIDLLNKNPMLKIEIQGHTDDKGNDDYNQSLSDKRARSVLEYLTSQNISKDRISSKGYGETKPQLPNTTDENRAVNRRVEFKVL